MKTKNEPLTFDDLADAFDNNKMTRGTPARCLPIEFVLDWARDKCRDIEYDEIKDLFFRKDKVVK